jgi:predicted RNA-binding Zn ribbon-like protein
VRTPGPHRAWDATNYLGGVADVLQNKSRRALAHLGELATVSVYENDRVIREVRYQHEQFETVGYRLRIWALDRPELEPGTRSDKADLSVAPRRARSAELCIEFVNTLVGTPSSGGEQLGTYGDLLGWGLDHGSVTPETLGLLQLAASLRASEAEKVILRSRRFREAIRVILLDERRVDGLEEVTENLQRYLPLQTLRWIDGKARWVWPDRLDLERILWPVAQSVLDLMTSDRRKRVRACIGCKQLFLDTSKNKQRRWCEMSSCGNRDKARAFQLRHHS